MEGLGPAGLALLAGPAVGGGAVPGSAAVREVSLMLYDAAKRPHTTEPLWSPAACPTLSPPAPGSAYATLSSLSGGAAFSLLFRDAATEWEPLATAFALASAAAQRGPQPPRVVVQELLLGSGGAAADDVAAPGDRVRISFSLWEVEEAEGEAPLRLSLGDPLRRERESEASLSLGGAPRGLLEGLRGCAAGGRRLVVVPPSCACAGAELLPPSQGRASTLVYDVTLHTARLPPLGAAGADAEAAAAAARAEAGGEEYL